MSKADNALRRLERQWTRRNIGRVLPIKILTYGADGIYHDDDGLYHEGNRTYTQEEMTALQADYQLIIACCGNTPTGTGRPIQMTWGDD